MKSWFDRFRRRKVQANEPSSTTGWGYLIHGYVSQLFGPGYDAGKHQKAEREINGRGLAFGKIRVLSSYGQVKLGLLGDQKIGIAEVRTALNEAVREAGLTGALERVRDDDQIQLDIISGEERYNLKGQHYSGFRGNEPINGTAFLQISCWGGAGIREMEAYSAEAVSILVRTAELLGFPPGTKHYAHESPVRIEDVVVYAVRWEDPDTGCRYLDVLYRPELVVHSVWQGCYRHDDRTVGSFKGEVHGIVPGGDWWPKISLNNRPVYSTIVEAPTPAILAAKERFAAEAKYHCHFCAKPATQQVNLVRFEADDFSMGGMVYVCDDDVCVSQARSQNCVRSSVSSFTPEVWA